MPTQPQFQRNFGTAPPLGALTESPIPRSKRTQDLVVPAVNHTPDQTNPDLRHKRATMTPKTKRTQEHARPSTQRAVEAPRLPNEPETHASPLRHRPARNETNPASRINRPPPTGGITERTQEFERSPTDFALRYRERPESAALSVVLFINRTVPGPQEKPHLATLNEPTSVLEFGSTCGTQPMIKIGFFNNLAFRCQNRAGGGGNW